MNSKIEKILKIADFLGKLNNKELNILKTYLLNNIDFFNDAPIALIQSSFLYLADQLTLDHLYADKNLEGLTDKEEKCLMK